MSIVDVWCDNISLVERYPGIRSSVRNNKAALVEFYAGNQYVTSWN